MQRTSNINRNTKETKVDITLDLDGSGKNSISTQIPFLDHMISLFSVHGFFDISIDAEGDIDVDFHHTVEDVGIVLGNCIDKALGNRNGIRRYGHAVTPMDEALTSVSIDLSKRPFLVFNVPEIKDVSTGFNVYLAKEFLRAFAYNGKMNLHINVQYGENEHHIIESIFKSLGKALDHAVSFDKRIKVVLSSKGIL